MPFPRTKARFVAHQTGIRPAATQRQILNEWDSKTAAQRASWVDRFGRVEAAYGTLQPRIVRATNLVNQVNHQDMNAVALLTTVEQFTAFFELVRSARRALHQVSDAFQRYADAWRTLRREEFTHVEVNPASIAYDNNTRAAALANKAATQNEDARLKLIQSRPPVHHDAVRNVHRMRRDWVQHDDKPIWARQTPLMNARANNDVGLNTPYTGTWVPWKDFQGGMGKGSVWLKFDAGDTLVDKVFRKDNFVDQLLWKDPVCWYGDVRDLQTRIPMEVRCHRLLEGGLAAGGPLVPAVAGVVRLREPHRANFIDNDNASYRMYLEYYSHGDLHSLIEQAIRLDKWIPGPFIWSVAERLALSGLQMLRGSAGQPDWEEMVHRDYKPANVFLGDEHPTIYPDYPQAMLGDFGLAFTTPRVPQGADPTTVDPLNPRWYHGSGTDGYMAPEQYAWVDQRHRGPANPYHTLDEFQIRESANVFGVGIIVWCLVTRQVDPNPSLWLGNAINDQTYDVPADIADRYDADLLNMIAACLRYDPAHRPTFAELERGIQLATGENMHLHQLDLTHGIRSGNATLIRKTRDNITCFIEPNGYLDGMARGDVPA